MMNRLSQKCVVASAGVHLLLALILVTCPAFLAPKSRSSDVTPITFYPSILIEQPFSSPGGSPGSRPPAPAPAPTPTPPAPVVRPAPAPLPQPTKDPEPVVTLPKEHTESPELAKTLTRKRPNITVTAVTRPSNAKPKPHEASTEDTREQRWLEARRIAANQIGKAASSIKSGTGSATKVEEGFGSGNSGPSYASYEAWVLKVFDDAWVAPEDAISEDATAKVSVTIASDGTVIAKRIIKRSGDPAVDLSVERALERVTTMGRPFPEGAKDKQRSYIIPFNMKTKRGAA